MKKVHKLARILLSEFLTHCNAHYPSSAPIDRRFSQAAAGALAPRASGAGASTNGLSWDAGGSLGTHSRRLYSWPLSAASRDQQIVDVLRERHIARTRLAEPPPRRRVIFE